MSIRKPLIGFTAFMVLAVVLTVLIYSTLQRGVVGSTNDYSANFSDASGLKVGDDVRIAGVRVGRVDKIELKHDNNATPPDYAVVDFQIEKDQKIFKNTKALVRYQNLIGQRYVALEMGEGTPEPMPAGGNIPMKQTEPSFDVSGLLGGLQPLFKVMDPKAVNSMSETFINALQGDKLSLSNFVTQATALSKTFADRDQILGDLIESIAEVTQGLANRSGQLDTLLAQSRVLIQGLSEQGASLKDATDRLSKSSTDLVNLITTIRPALKEAQDSSTGALNLLIATGPKMDRLAVEGPLVLTDLARISSEGAYLGINVCLLDVSLWGVIFPRGLFEQIGGSSHSEVCR
ncbi:MAG: MCE family protein [Nocardiaceae bacterium]|nr:MCE family protein [Nocardiaceae bacterium]